MAPIGEQFIPSHHCFLCAKLSGNLPSFKRIKIPWHDLILIVGTHIQNSLSPFLWSWTAVFVRKHPLGLELFRIPPQRILAILTIKMLINPTKMINRKYCQINTSTSVEENKAQGHLFLKLWLVLHLVC